MARIILLIVAAIAIVVVLSTLFWSLLHLLTIGFWIVVIALLGFGLFRVGRWSRSKNSAR